MRETRDFQPSLPDMDEVSEIDQSPNDSQAQPIHDSCVPTSPTKNQLPQILLHKTAPSITPSSSASCYGYKQILKLNDTSVLSLDSPVSHHLLEKFDQHNNHSPEFTHVTYNSISSTHPSECLNNLTLRQQRNSKNTEFLICLTPNLLSDTQFCRTLSSILKNISFLCSRTRSQTWGKNSWQKLVILIVADRKTIHPRILNVLTVIGLYHENLIKSRMGGKNVQSHVFEYTTQLSIDSDMTFRNDIMPYQLILCLNEQYSPQFESHFWFYKVFAELLQPNICIAIETGVKVDSTCLYHAHKAFQRDSKIGGLSVETRVEIKNYGLNLLNPIVAIQNFEMKQYHIMNKSTSSLFGFVPVIGDAFSAFRFTALQGQPLQIYLGQSGTASTFTEAIQSLSANNLLAHEIVCKLNEKWTIKYESSASVEIEVASTIDTYMQNQKTVTNNSIFSVLHSIIEWRRILLTSHSFIRKLVLLVQVGLHFFESLFSWFLIVGLFYQLFFVFN